MDTVTFLISINVPNILARHRADFRNRLDTLGSNKFNMHLHEQQNENFVANRCRRFLAMHTPPLDKEVFKTIPVIIVKC